YPAFMALLLLNGIGSGLFAAPNTTGIMNAVPSRQRGAASGMRATFMNSGMVLSIGLFFSLMIAGLASTLPATMEQGLTANGVPPATAAHLAHLPPVGSLFAAFLGFNPMHTLLGDKVLAALPPDKAAYAAGVTPRTLRYYEELGLLRPSAHSVRGARRYAERDLARFTRIRELQQLMGFNLEEIGQILSAEDSLERIRGEYRSGKPTSRRRRELLAEAIEINDRLREQVRQKVSRIAGLLEALDAKAVRYRQS